MTCTPLIIFCAVYETLYPVTAYNGHILNIYTVCMYACRSVIVYYINYREEHDVYKLHVYLCYSSVQLFQDSTPNNRNQLHDYSVGQWIVMCYLRSYVIRITWNTYSISNTEILCDRIIYVHTYAVYSAIHIVWTGNHGTTYFKLMHLYMRADMVLCCIDYI